MPFDSLKLALVILTFTKHDIVNTGQDIKILHQAPRRILFDFLLKNIPISDITPIR